MVPSPLDDRRRIVVICFVNPITNHAVNGWLDMILIFFHNIQQPFIKQSPGWLLKGLLIPISTPDTFLCSLQGCVSLESQCLEFFSHCCTSCDSGMSQATKIGTISWGTVTACGTRTWSIQLCMMSLSTKHAIGLNNEHHHNFHHWQCNRWQSKMFLKCIQFSNLWRLQVNAMIHWHPFMLQQAWHALCPCS